MKAGFIAALFIFMLSGCVSSSRVVEMRGTFVWTQERQTLVPCGSDETLWVRVGASIPYFLLSQKMDELVRQDATREVLATFTGELSRSKPSGGLPFSADGVFYVYSFESVEHGHCTAATGTFNLMEIAPLGHKGRIQDQEYRPRDAQVAAILAMGKDAIPPLIDALESERPYEDPPANFWSTMVEGDVALIVLSDLFLDPTWTKSTLPEFCWDTLLGRSSAGVTGPDLLHDFVEAHGRSELARRWRQAWAKDGARARWDSGGQYFRIDGRELKECQ